MRQGIAIPLARKLIFTCHFFCFLFLCSENALPFGDFNGVFVAVSIFFANRNGDAFEKIVIHHFKMSRPTHQRSVIILLPRWTCHISSLSDSHRAYRKVYHIRLCSNEGEYCGFNSGACLPCGRCQLLIY